MPDKSKQEPEAETVKEQPVTQEPARREQSDGNGGVQPLVDEDIPDAGR